MDKIFRKIKLSDFYNRHSDRYAVVSGTSVAKDICIEVNDNRINPEWYYRTLPLIFIEEENYYLLRFRTMTRRYGWLLNFFNESLLFKCVNIKGVSQLSYQGNGSMILKSFEDGTSNALWTKVVAIVNNDELPYYDFSEVSCGEYVLASERASEYCAIFGYIADNLLLKAGREYYVFVKNALNDENIGTETPYLEIGLYIGENISDIGQLNAAIETWKPGKEYTVGEYVYYLSSADTNEVVCYVLTGGTGFIYNPNTHKIEFDWNGWEQLESNDSPSTVSGVVTESKLMTLKRNKVSYDDYGNVLPFIFNGATAELEFSENVKRNITYLDNGDIQYDFINAITYSGDNITFQYVIGKIENTSETTCEGVKYSETYHYDIKIMPRFKYNGTYYDNVSYTAITFQTEEINSNFDPNKLYSEVEIESFDRGVQVPYFKDERYLGIDDIMRDTSTYKIERGKSSAFERHNILGECSSMDDLEKYRNDFFTIKKE